MGKPVPTAEQTIRPGERPIDSTQAVRFERLPVTLTADGNLKAGPGYLGNLVITNGGGAAITVTLVNAATGSTPVVAPVAVPAGAMVALLDLGWFFDTTIRVVSSSWTGVTVCGGVS